MADDIDQRAHAGGAEQIDLMTSRSISSIEQIQFSRRASSPGRLWGFGSLCQRSIWIKLRVSTDDRILSTRFAMYSLRARLLTTVLLVTPGAVAAGAGPDHVDDPVEFRGDIQPILSSACFHCHGADASQRQAGLRLDHQEGLLADRGGYRAVVPGNADDSELFQRIASGDPDQRMPPADAARRLSAREIELIRRWIEQGAEWEPHWSFVAPRRPELPSVADATWSIQELDRFVLARLEQSGMRPAPPADKERLLRRVTLDLTGLPPTLEELDTFLADDSPGAYEHAVDRLLSSPRYGERMAAVWLDLARFADSDGYQDDEPRTMWRWRDWLIETLNDNLPFDQFTIQQLAGDLLPDATLQQRLATGFLRNNRANGEGGAIADEYRLEYIVDRVETVSTVWMGLTAGCARCHDHKYDPLSQKEFYELFAFFNQIPEPGIYRRKASPLLKVPTRDEQRRLEEIESEWSGHEEGSSRYEKLVKARKELWDGVVETMVMDDTESRDTFILLRGQYNRPGDKVTASVPEWLLPLPEESQPNRLGLARWLVDPAHPQTTRVTANRLWQNHFGTGLVKTLEDFGIQGELPSHPDLLDWLATKLIRLEWDIKSLQRMIVTSATYRQSSRATAAVRNADPDNRLLSRGPRMRLPAEMIRDQAIYVSGLLHEQIGGPSVKPYQPEKMWMEISGVREGVYADGYVPSAGGDLYRRSIYTHWRRTIPPPTMDVFDAPSREVCTARREGTNTPLQALALMNDVTYVEAARELAARMMQEGGTESADRIVFGFRLVTSRFPTDRELKLLLAGLDRHQQTYRDNAELAARLAGVGESKPDTELDVKNLAAHTALASTLLNLDETITKP